MTSVEITYLFRDVQGRTVHVDVLGARNCWSPYATGMSEWAQKIDLLHPFFCFKMDQNGPFMIFLLFRMVHLWFFCCSKWFIYDFSVVQNGSFMTFLLLKMVHLWLFCCWTWFIYVFSVAVALQQNAYRMLLRCWFRIRQRENKNASAFPQRCRIWNQDDTWMMFSLEFPAFQLWKTTFGDCQKHAE